MLKVDVVNIADIEMKYLVFGEGHKNLVILPGLSFKPICDNAEAVRTAYALFESEYRVWLFDRRNNMPDFYNTQMMVADMRVVMQTLKMQKVDIIGVSQGGMIALYLALDYPELINKLVLASSICHLSKTSRQLFEKWLALADEGNIHKLVSDSIEHMYGESILANYRDVLINTNLDLDEENLRKYRIMIRAALSFDFPFSAIESPLLAIGSLGDRIFEPDSSKEVAGQLGGEYFLYGSEYGHCVYDEADDYKSRVLAFLKA